MKNGEKRQKTMKSAQFTSTINSFHMYITVFMIKTFFLPLEVDPGAFITEFTEPISLKVYSLPLLHFSVIN